MNRVHNLLYCVVASVFFVDNDENDDENDENILN